MLPDTTTVLCVYQLYSYACELAGFCPSLTDPKNGAISCSLGYDGVPSYEDTCSFTCNTGYELTGSDTRTCQSDGSWSGSDDVCRRGRCHLCYIYVVPVFIYAHTYSCLSNTY